MNYLIDQSISDNTKKVYSQALDAFRLFLIEHSLPVCWPPTLLLLVQFIAHLSKFKKCSFSTIQSYLSGISFFLKLNNLPDLTHAFVIQKMVCGLRRTRPVKDTRMPVTLDLLKTIIRALPFVASSKYESALYNAAYNVAFFGFLRVGEIAIDGKSGIRYKVAQFSDLTLMEDKCTLTIRYSKTDQNGSAVTLSFPRSSDINICPVQAVNNFLKQRPNVEGPLFCHLSSEPMTKYQFRAMLRKCLHFVGIKANIKSHSFRIGATTLASSLNVAEGEIKQMGRWSSRGATHRRYIRLDKIIPQ